ncbi:TSUP family transporter [Pelagibacteraceae bacterium]|nr:TSUP family transporter [Pelagibacteraceae bacterium]
MQFLIEISIIIFLIIVQSIFGVGLLLFGTPSFLLLGYDFANTINILVPISIFISLMQFFRSKVTDKNFITQYNFYCLPFLIIFMILALKLIDIIDFKFFVALLLILSSFLILNKKRFSNFKETFFKLKRIILIIIGSIHGFTNMGGSFLSIFSTLVSGNKKELARYYISYGYLIMGVIQYFIVLILTYDFLEFSKIYYVLLALMIYFPSQKIFKNINNKKFSKYINIIALVFGLLIVITYLK